jgi:glycine dehydrogenase subunit 1
MLAAIGVGSVEELFSDVPEDKLLHAPLDLPRRKTELEVSRILRGLARKNHAAGDGPFFLGAGAYRHHVPASVDHIIQRSEFLTSYTPYQPEITQGTLQYLFEFQTQVANLTAMEVANASMYDGSTGTAEAVLMAHRVTRRRKAVISGGLHPQYRDVIATNSAMAGDSMVTLDPDPRGTEDILAAIDGETSCVVVQSPSFYGQLINLRPIAAKAQANGALLIAVFTEVVSLGLIEPPGAQGGRHRRRRGPGDRQCALVRRTLCRPLRHQGQVHPADARPALRRNGRRGGQARLCADPFNTGAAHPPRQGDLEHLHQFRASARWPSRRIMTLLGEHGLSRLAEANHARACQLADALAGVPGVEVLNECFFNEFTVRLPKPAAEVVEVLARQGIVAGLPVSRLEPTRPELADLLVVAATETATEGDIAWFVRALEEAL